MAFEFVIDTKIKNRAYPALAQWQARPYTQSWREFGDHWPYTTPLRIEEYCRTHDIEINLHAPQDAPPNCFYPICLGFFDFNIDYIELLPAWCAPALRQGKTRLLFMYHEGDAPGAIKTRLDFLCAQHALDPDCYVFVSSNSRAGQYRNFVVFHDFELWYHQRNIDHAPRPISHNRDRDFLCLSRTHKSWRAAAMADLVRSGSLERSLWSYCAAPVPEDFADCPIQIDQISQLRFSATRFLADAPYLVDNMSDHERNDHSLLASDLFDRTYCNIVLESQFDVDGSDGAFLTEKTFKAIKHGQLFFVAGGAGSLAALRSLGYRVFDDILDNSYDTIEDPTERWLALKDSISAAKAQGLADLYAMAENDLQHNQHLFLSAPPLRLNNLMHTLDNIW